MKHTSDFLWLSILQNRIYSALRTNYVTQSIPGAAVISYYPGQYSTSNGTCSCTADTACSQQSGFYNLTGYKTVNATSTTVTQIVPLVRLLSTVPGIMAGCLPYNSLLQSTLQCFYNQSCIDHIQTFIHGFSLVSPLSSSHFPQDTTVKSLLDELFVESWNEKN